MSPERNPVYGEYAFWAIIAALYIGLFHFMGNVSDVSLDSRSLFVWLGRQLLARAGDFSNAWVIPLVSLGIVIWKRRALAEAPRSTDYVGLAVVVGSLALHWVSYRIQQPRASLIAMVGLLLGIPYFLYGRHVARILLFPCAYLFLCFTTYILVYFTFPLRLISSAVAVGILNGLGIATQREGTQIFAEGFALDIVEACSGLRSLFVMSSLAAPFAYFTQKTLVKKWALFVLSLPLAMLTNTLRIVTIALVARFFNQELALKIYHDFSGYLVFFISILLLSGTGNLLERLGRRRKDAS